MGKTARDLVTSAYRKSGIVGRVSEPTKNEIEDGLQELNQMIEGLNTESLWPSSLKKIEKILPFQNEFTIGLSDSLITSINNQGPGNVTVFKTAIDLDYSAGDKIEITDTVNFNGIFTIGVVIAPDNYELSDGQIAVIASELTGNVWTESAADINERRPISLDSIRVLVGSQWIPLDQESEKDWFKRSQLDTTTAYAAVFSYRATSPYGTILFDRTISTSYTYQILYNDAVLEYALDDEISLPPGYYQYLDWALGENFSIIGGLNHAICKSKADAALYKLKINNSQALVLDLRRSGGRYDYKSDRIAYGRR